MMRIIFKLLLLNLAQVCCLITLRELFEAHDIKDNGDGVKICETPLLSEKSLLDGLCLIPTSTIFNLRLYCPEVKRYFTPENGWYTQKYTDDSSELANIMNDDDLLLGFSICRLFLLQGDTNITISAGGYAANIEKLFSASRSHPERRDIKMFAGILYCLNNKQALDCKFHTTFSEAKLQIISKSSSCTLMELEVNFGDNKIAKDQNKPTDREEKFREIAENTILGLLKGPCNNDIFSAKNICKAYICYYLASSRELKQFYYFYDKIAEICNNNMNNISFIQTQDINNLSHDPPAGVIVDTMSLANIKISREVLDIEELICQSLIIADSKEKVFPYNSKSGFTGFYVPCVYSDHSTGVLKFGRDKDGFSNCVEIALYYFLNCLLWDIKNKCYMTPDVPNCKITEFFQGQNMKVYPDINEVKEWHKMIENLHGAKYTPVGKNTKNHAYSFKSNESNFFYNRDSALLQDGTKVTCYNELLPGLVNCLKIIGVLFDKHSEVVAELSKLLETHDKDVKVDLNKVAVTVKNIFNIILGNDNAKELTIDFIDINNKLMKEADYEYQSDIKDIFCKMRVSRKYDSSNISSVYSLSSLKRIHLTFELNHLDINESTDLDEKISILNENFGKYINNS